MFNNSKEKKIGFLVCGIAALFYCYEYLLRITPSIMMDELSKTFQASATQIGVLSACFYFVYTPMQLVVGILSDYFGSRRVLLFAIAGCVIGNALFGQASSLTAAYIGRGIIGLGSAFAFVGSIKLASAWLPPSYISLFVGLTTALGMLGAIWQTNVLPQVMHALGWHRIVSIGTWFGIALLGLSYLVLHDSPEAWPFAGCSRATDGNKQLVAERAQLSLKKVWNNLLQVAFTGKIWMSGIIAGVLYLSLSMVAELWGIPMLSEIYGLSATDAAASCSMIYLGWLIGGPLAGYLGVRVDTRKLLFWGLVFSGAIIAAVVYGATWFSTAGCRMALCLFGMASSVEILCFDLSNQFAPPEAVATSTSFTNCLVMLGGFIAQPLIGAILDMSAGDGAQVRPGGLITSYNAASFQWAFAILPLMIVVGLVILIWLKPPVKTAHNG